MIVIIGLLVFFTVLGVLLYHRASMPVFLIGSAIDIVWFDAFSGASMWFVLVFFFLWVLLLPFAFKNIRQRYITPVIFNIYKRVMPSMSATEQEALEAGTVWWDKDLFSGRPDWNKFLATSKPALTEDERAFLDGPVEQLCSMINDWEIIRHQKDLSPEVWHFIREQGFFGLIIPKVYGGKEFSAFAHFTILVKLFSCSITAASTVAVPNSLGPAELLLHYGTDEQKNFYLPRLARGEEIPCFALTSPTAGSDAASITDHGVVCKGVFEGKEVTGIRLQWDKRYITLAPVATVLGLAFKLYDPDHLLGDKESLGITCALIPTTTAGVVIGRRHLPAGAVFQNGPTQGKDVFIPLDWVIGGEKMVGHGWRMLMECLSAGRSISLPSSGVAGSKMAAYATGAYARIRRQFNMPIGAFEGVEAVLARIVGLAYEANAAARLTVHAVDLGEKPPVLSAIVKYHCTEIGRQTISDAMDVHGGKAVCLGPNNYLAAGFQGTPVGITVEGANILTRNMIIYGQGAMRCHPYVLDELHAGIANDLIAFDKVFFSHIGFTFSNIARSLGLGLSQGRFANVPKGKLARHFQQLSRFSAAFALVSDLTMALLGGELKRRERLSARLGDVLSDLYIGSAVLKHYIDQGMEPDDYPLVRWVMADLCFKMQEALHDLLSNYPNRWVGFLLKGLVFPLGRHYKKPTDKLDHKIASLVMNESGLRERLAKGLYTGSEGHNQLDLLRKTLAAVIAIEPIEKTVRYAQKKRDITGHTLAELVDAALAKGLITSAEAQSWHEADALRARVIHVDDFSPEELKAIY